MPARIPSSPIDGSGNPGPTPAIAWLRMVAGEEIPKKALGMFFDVLATLLHAGISQPEAIVRASNQVDSELLHICRIIAPQLRNGGSFADCLRLHNHRFPAIVVPILAVGDTSGTLEHSARHLADTFQGGVSIERRMRGKVFNPWAAIFVICMFRTYQLLAAGTLSVSSINYESIWTLVFCSVVYLGGRLVWRVLAKWVPLRIVVDTIAIALPNVGKTLRLLASARWARSFATLWSAGIPVSTALEVSARTASNAYYERAFLECAIQTRKGRSLAQSLKSTQLLPKNLLAVIDTGEESGRVAEGLESLAKIVEEDAFTRALQTMNGAVIVIQILTIIIMVTMALSALV